MPLQYVLHTVLKFFGIQFFQKVLCSNLTDDPHSIENIFSI